MADEPTTEKKPRKFPDVRRTFIKRGGPQFFAVMREGGGLPTVLHETFGRAAYQADKLAHENPGHRFHVLASQRVSVADPAPAETAEQEAA